jgi:light-regulated signal transduction histidine kinase (bacteriophytochrome)
MARSIAEKEKAISQSNAELASANKELEAFSYSVSHDLRAPLRAIDGFSQALLEDSWASLDDTGKDNLNRVRSAAQRMGRLIDDILEMSRVTRQELASREVDLVEQARDILLTLKKTEPHRNVEFVAPAELTVNGDRRLMEILLNNLLNNAWKFTGKHPSARIELGVRQDAGKKVYFIKDDGAGFDMAYSDKLFTPFQRLHNPVEFPGTGIGLATARRIVHRHGGSIWAEGRVETGAAIYFTLND